jgi:hypothetical protein
LHATSMFWRLTATFPRKPINLRNIYSPCSTSRILRRLTESWPLTYYWSAYQSEWATDLCLATRRPWPLSTQPCCLTPSCTSTASGAPPAVIPDEVLSRHRQTVRGRLRRSRMSLVVEAEGGSLDTGKVEA